MKQFRKILPFLCAFFLGAFLGRPLLLSSIGILTKSIFYFDQGWTFSYGSIDWYEKKIVFSDIALREKGAFVIQAPKMDLMLSKRHLHFQNPHLDLTGPPSAQSSDWTVSMQEGTLQLPDIQKATFSFEKTASKEVGRMDLHWGNTHVFIEALEVQKNLSVALSLEGFDGKILSSWCELEGIFDGKIHLQCEEMCPKTAKIELALQNAGFGPWITKARGTFDFEGDLPSSFSEFCRQKGRLKAQLETACIAEMDEVQGEFSFTSDVGAKWEFQAKTKDKPLLFEGRFFTAPKSPAWMDARFSVDQSTFLISNLESKERFFWDIEVDTLTPYALNFLTNTAFPDEKPCEMLQGLFKGKAHLITEKLTLLDWNLDLQMERALFQSGEKKVALKNGEVSFHKGQEKGQFSFEGGAFSMGYLEIPFQGKQLQGEGCYENGNLSCRMQGVVLDETLEVSLEGSACDFTTTIKASEEKALFLQGGFLEEGLQVQKVTLVKEQFQMEGEGTYFWDQEFVFSFRGQLPSKVPFSLPLFTYQQGELLFDFRLQTPKWDAVRLVGSSKGEGDLSFQPQYSHILGQPFQIEQCSWDRTGLQELKASMDLPWLSLLSIAPSFSEHLSILTRLPLQGSTHLAFDFLKEKVCRFNWSNIDLYWEQTPFSWDFSAKYQDGVWFLDQALLGTLSLQGELLSDKNGVWVKQATAQIPESFSSTFSGKIQALDSMEWSVAGFEANLSTLPFSFPFAIQGTLSGKGCLTYNQELDADFDLNPLSLNIEEVHLENSGSLHMHYDPKEGFAFQGVDLCATVKEHDPIYCKAQLMQVQDRLSFQHAHLCLPMDLFQTHRVSKLFDQDLDVTVDFSCLPDFSELTLWMKEGYLPVYGKMHHIKRLQLNLEEETILGELDYLYQGDPIHMGFAVLPEAGKISFSDPLFSSESPPLTVHWKEDNQEILIQEVEGAFGDVEASFHAMDPNFLMGSIRFNCAYASKFLPEAVSEVFSILEMGKGYELKGELHLGNKPFFEGLLSGKQVELLGFQFRSLLSNISLSDRHVLLQDFKISDAAGLCTIEEISSLEGPSKLWTLEIPQAKVSEFRPSLLQKVGMPPPTTAGPLVIRDLLLKDLTALAANKESYRGEGEVSFINSYRREHTIFDIPSDLLGKLGGFNFSLLVPVCGKLAYKISDGFIHLTELEEAFSEGRRSQFFLNQDPSPKLDLLGNLDILIEMKQFGLFKFMESFMISIQGDLTDPKFHLEKKKRFWGL